ncbi:Vitamin B12 ABC transporter, B12-binding component BtuF [Labilithrix luteola]|uniref:Vitamin B12 ABC transporter, B12-binding component BtuF n=1 Tax=Labilithrix luteola TaxID=1391654 RepID=A0A0K1PUJ6_9BACT|nr:helical backbone metal receptor [Labilithrix luteola]AKU96799.1 Vitamin B12 ABC transporter, B12-binding component BtuF [Labilithrix luteola]
MSAARPKNGARATSSRGVLLVVLAFLFLATGCRGKSQEPAAHDDAGSKGAPKRIVSLSPSTTEALFVIGAGKEVVGRSRYCDWPKEVLALPQVGGYVDPSLEAILALKPDLVTGARGPAGAAITERLEQRGIATYFPKTENFAEIDTMIRGLGERTGHVEQASAQLGSMHRRIADIEKAVGQKPPVRVLLVFGLAPLSVAGPEGFADEMIRHAGGINVVTGGGAYPTIGVERVMSLDPDVIVNAAMAESHGNERITKDAPGWSNVRAVKTDHVVSITDESVLRPGPRIADGLATLAKAIHPDVPLDAAAAGRTSPP